MKSNLMSGTKKALGTLIIVQPGYVPYTYKIKRNLPGTNQV